MENDQLPSRREPQLHPGAEAPEHAVSTAPENILPQPAAPHPGDDAAPGTPGTGEDICQRCTGTGKIPGNQDCPDCDGTGIVVQGIGGG